MDEIERKKNIQEALKSIKIIIINFRINTNRKTYLKF